MTKQYNIAVQRLKLPPRMLKLPVDERGFPVPKFVQWIDGKPDFRVVNQAFMANAVRIKLCWLCGEALGRYQAFVIGPMCSINRVSSEPPSHLECARFAVQACPFLTQPKRERNEHELPDNRETPGGVMILHNPGVSLIYVTESYKPIKVKGGTLFQIGDPTSVEWWARGRHATHDEVMDAIAKGLPALVKEAKREGPDAEDALHKMMVTGLALVPGKQANPLATGLVGGPTTEQ
jgi:hypothetical protein